MDLDIELRGLKREANIGLVRKPKDARTIPLGLMTPGEAGKWLKKQPAAVKAWAGAHGFEGKAGQMLVIAADDGSVERVLVGLGEKPDMWALGDLPGKLPAGLYELETKADREVLNGWLLGWALGCYRFDVYTAKPGPKAELVWPKGVDRTGIMAAAAGTFTVRDLVNTPAEDMGPEALSKAAHGIGASFGAQVSEIVGEDLVAQNFPAIWAVGRAAGATGKQAPRLIDMQYGRKGAKKITIIGKGVCFDTGGLNLKPGSAMGLMKKDMGGAAHALGLARIIMQTGMDVDLRVLIPAVENNVAGNAFRPGDIIDTRAGITVQIDNTDAEGRLVLADALALAAEEKPELIVDFATLTGAARVALGPDLPAMFARQDATARLLEDCAAEVTDPLWRLPLWPGYEDMIKVDAADITNSAPGSFAGAITAALFLQHFVPEGQDWVHLDTFAWNQASRPGRPKGGEALGMRAVAGLIEKRLTP